jgi:hypothetical protein
MAVKITHRINGQQIRFANGDGAARYAEIIGGGVDKWVFTTVTAADACSPAPRPDVVPVGPGEFDPAPRG